MKIYGQIWKKGHETGYYKVNERGGFSKCLVSSVLPLPLTTFPLGEASDLLQLVFFSLSAMSRHWREISQFQIGAGR